MWLMNAYRGGDGHYILVPYPLQYEGRDGALYLGVMAATSLGVETRRGIVRQLVEQPFARVSSHEFFGLAAPAAGRVATG